MNHSAGWWGALTVQLITIALFINLLRLEVKWSKLGTKSVLYGAHCFFLHPWFVAKAWHQLYGFRKVTDRYVGEISLWNPRLWLVFMLHDIGYIGKEKMDDELGETHPAIGARIVGRLFGEDWWWFSLLHSRYYSKSLGMAPSLLCIADKLAIILPPKKMYLFMVRATGEIHEYMAANLARQAAGEKLNITYGRERPGPASEELWYDEGKKYVIAWVEAHKNGEDDTWTAGRPPYEAGEPLHAGALVEIRQDGKVYNA